MTLTKTLYQPGTGISLARAKLPTATVDCIELLGQMNDRLNVCIETGDRVGLLELAAEYKEKNMTATAHRITLLAKEGKR